MALSEKEIRDIVSKVTAEVEKEVQGLEARFHVKDLIAHVRDLAQGGVDNSAWKITYDTSSSVIQSRPGLESAWKITYDTSSSIIQNPGSSQKT